MVTRPQLDRLNARIEALADGVANSYGPAAVYVWQEADETEEQALERHYRDRPEARRAREVLVFSWER